MNDEQAARLMADDFLALTEALRVADEEHLRARIAMSCDDETPADDRVRAVVAASTLSEEIRAACATYVAYGKVYPATLTTEAGGIHAVCNAARVEADRRVREALSNARPSSMADACGKLGERERERLAGFETQVKAMVVGLGMSRAEAVDAIVDSNHGPVAS